MTDIQAAIGIVQMGRLSSFLEKRKQIARKYMEGIRELPFETPEFNPGCTFYRFILKCEPENADFIIEEMKKRAIDCEKPIFLPLHNIYSSDNTLLPVTEDVYKRCISIPIYPALTDTEVSWIMKNLKEVAEVVKL